MATIEPIKNKEIAPQPDVFRLGKLNLSSRLLLGTGKYGDLTVMQKALTAAGTNVVTVALRRMEPAGQASGSKTSRHRILDYIPRQAGGDSVYILPNTSGARTAGEAILAAELSRQLLQTDLIKLEIHPDPVHLMPDPVETLKAAEALVQKGFTVLPYVHADPVLCKRLEQAGVAAVMPLGSPIGTNKGLKSRDFLEIIIEQATVPVIIDAGIGRPSDASLAMELGADAVLISTAVATATDPVQMALAFKMAVAAGRLAYKAGVACSGMLGEGTSPLTDFLS